MYILFAVLGAIALFIAILLVRAACYRPKANPAADIEFPDFDREASVTALQKLVQCKTVSYYDKSLEDNAEFDKLIALLPTLYPNVVKNCEMKQLPDRALLFRWKGKNEGDPAVMMAHYDVVPVDEGGWEKDPFAGIIEDGTLWGRGTLDTKVTFNGILSAAETLTSQNFVPEHDIYFAFSGGEEVNGEGAVRIVDYFEENKITPAMVVDEGGAVVEGVFPGVKAPCGLIGTAEKGMMNVTFSVDSQGGHASAPPPRTSIGRLSNACLRLENKPFPMHLAGPAAEMFDTLGRHSSFALKIVFANLWCFRGVLDLLGKKMGGEINALLRTTVAFTQTEGSSAPNVLPPRASMTANMRLNPHDTVESAKARLAKVIDDDKVKIEIGSHMNPSRVSVSKCEAYDKVAAAVASTWQGCIVSPYLMVQCSDSRHWGRISDKVYRFSAMALTSEERKTIHGHNERIRLENIEKAVEFYLRLMRQC